MDFRQLKHIVALAEQGTYAKAAEAVYLSQSALSRSIQQLELQFGIPLFERGRFGATLTAYGQVSLPHIRGLIASEEALKQAIESVKALKSGELKIGTGPYPAVTLIDKVSASFVDRYPEIRLSIKTDNWANLRKALLSNEIELFIADIRELQNDPLLSITALPALAGVVFCRANHPLSSAGPLQWADLLQYPFAMPKLSAEIEQFFQRASQPFGGLTRRVECDNIMLLLEIVLNSQSFSMAPYAVIAEHLATGSLTTVTVSDLSSIHTSYGIVSRAHRPLSPAGSAYTELLQQQASV